MSTEIEFGFPRTFACDVLDELPSGVAPQRYFFPRHQNGAHDGLIVRVLPETSDVWVGVFAFGSFGGRGLSRVLSMPDPEKLCVVSRGAGFVVSTSKPDVWSPIAICPVVHARVAHTAGLIVFADYTDILAYGEAGVKWRTKRLAWDGLKIVSVGDRTLIGEYWDIRDEEIREFEVDLATGEARGGVEP